MKPNTKQFAVVTVGAPGSGKSTFARNLMQQDGFTYVNYDAIRKELWGDENTQGSWGEISKVVDKQISESKDNIVVDGCHHTKKYRKEICNKLKSKGFNYIVGVFINSSLENCLKQNYQRERQVPEEVITKIWNKLDQSKENLLDCFDELTIYDPETHTAKTLRNRGNLWKSRNQQL